MAINITVIRTKGVLKTALTEVLNFTVSKQALLDIAAQIEQPGQYEIQVDSRESDAVFSMVDTDQVDEMLAVHPPLRESKMTLVTREAVLTERQPTVNPVLCGSTSSF